MKHIWEVLVGNVGCVFHGHNGYDAIQCYGEYKRMSIAKYGRIAGEPVTLFKNGEIYFEHKEETL